MREPIIPRLPRKVMARYQRWIGEKGRRSRVLADAPGDAPGALRRVENDVKGTP